MSIEKILPRYKKKEFEGFKDYVKILETTPKTKRTEKFLLATLEDPVYMSWVAKNLLDIHQILKLDSDSMKMILSELKLAERVLSFSFYQTAYEKDFFQWLSPALKTKYQDELELLYDQKTVIEEEKQEIAQFTLLSIFRQLQESNKLTHYPWRFPSLQVIKLNKVSVENGAYQLFFDDEQKKLAMSGEMKNSLRQGEWLYYYTHGKLFARGHYHQDEKHGEWTFYYHDEKLKSQGQFEHDRKIGVWSEWDRSNHLTQTNYDQK